MAKQLSVLREITDEEIVSYIYLIRGQKVMLDKELAELYGVEVKVLNQAVKETSNVSPPSLCFNLKRKNGQT